MNEVVTYHYKDKYSEYGGDSHSHFDDRQKLSERTMRERLLGHRNRKRLRDYCRKPQQLRQEGHCLLTELLNRV